jgi:hypothetical protein
MKSTPDSGRLLDSEGPAAAVLREYARRTEPAQVERWLPSPGRSTGPSQLRPSVTALGGLMAAVLGVWLLVQPRPGAGLDGSGGTGGNEGASGSELGVGGGRGRGGVPTATMAGQRDRAG